jgi:acyl-CoA reductase-like NAD-dependent aldehyde dehydrogenase
MSIVKTKQDWLAAAKKLDLQVRPFVNGQFIDSRSKNIFKKYNPANGALLAEFAEGSVDDVNAAVQAAREAFADGRWSNLPVTRRQESLLKLADLIHANAEDLALRDALEVGKPISDALQVDLPLSQLTLRHDAKAADKLLGEVYPTDSRSLALTMRVPRGVVAGIVGWNFPLALALVKVGPALATGNCMVLKPSELSSLSALRLAQLAIEAGIPEGVLNVVPGTGPVVGDALARHMDVNMLSFTGSTATGKRLMVAAGQSNMKKLLLECGGKSPNIVFDDCPDLEVVADAVVGKMYFNQGQVCTAGTRLLVQEGIKQALLDLVMARSARLRPAHPLDPAANFGALISYPQMEKVLSYIQSGREAGAEIVLGGNQVLQETGGYYIEPTICDRVQSQMKIAQEEIFGPVLSIISFRDTEEAIRIANDTMYGLSATVWTRDLTRAYQMIRGIRGSMITVRATAAPSAGSAFGALPTEPHNQSGHGVEGGLEGLKEFTYLRTAEIFID